MAYKIQKPCKVCGKMYTPCNDCENDNSVFHWRTVACSIACASKYFEMVSNARNSKPENMTMSTDEKISEVTELSDENKVKKIYKKVVKKNNEESEQID